LDDGAVEAQLAQTCAASVPLTVVMELFSYSLNSARAECFVFDDGATISGWRLRLRIQSLLI
jgi:hypothetical protein